MFSMTYVGRSKYEFRIERFDLKYIVSTLRNFSEIEKAAIFGSRAKGNYKSGSDIDIAIYGEEITFDTIAKLHGILEDESPLPYFFDIVDFTHSNHKELRKHIERIGKIIYEKNDTI